MPVPCLLPRIPIFLFDAFLPQVPVVLLIHQLLMLLPTVLTSGHGSLAAASVPASLHWVLRYTDSFSGEDRTTLWQAEGAEKSSGVHIVMSRGKSEAGAFPLPLHIDYFLIVIFLVVQ